MIRNATVNNINRMTIKAVSTASTRLGFFATSKTRQYHFTSSQAVPSDEKSHLLIDHLRQLDTACLCDAYKKKLTGITNDDGTKKHTTPTTDIQLNLLNQPSNNNNDRIPYIQPINTAAKVQTFAGYAFLIECTIPNDFLVVLEGLYQAKKNDVLFVKSHVETNTAVLGELLATEAKRKELCAIIIYNGYVRDTKHLQTIDIPVYAKSVTPRAGTFIQKGIIDANEIIIQKPQQDSISNNNTEQSISIRKGDIIVGDADGIITGSIHTFQQILEKAQNIAETEKSIEQRIEAGDSLQSVLESIKL